MKNIIIIGSSGHAKVVKDVIAKEGRFKVVRVLNLGQKPRGRSLIDFVKKNAVYGGIVAIGDNWARKEVADRLLKIIPDFRFITAVHPSAQIGDGVTIGDGTVVMAGVIINSDTKIGRFCILNTRSSVDHDSVMEDFSSLAPGVTTGGNVRIGAFSAVSLGARIIHKISIGEHTVIGAGATVVKTIPSYSIAYGVPARIIRKRRKGAKYL